MPLIGFRNTKETQNAAEALYQAAVVQSRQPVFYAKLGVPDTLDGRFDMIALHVFLLLRRLRAAGKGADGLAQKLFDVMFEDMDHSLRELGVGDLGVGRRVKAMAKAFYGRIAAYEAGLEGDDDVLGGALARNLFRTVVATPGQRAALCAYLRREAASLGGWPGAALRAGCVSFGAPPGGDA